MTEPVLECRDVAFEKDGDLLFSELSFRLMMGQGGLVLSRSIRRSKALLRLCATLKRPSRGALRWFGLDDHDVNNEQLHSLRRRIGYVHRETRLVSNLTLLDNMVLGTVYHRNIHHEEAYEQIRPLMQEFQLDRYRNYRPSDMSYERQRLATYVRELIKKPKLFLLENPAQDLNQDFHAVIGDILQAATIKDCAFIIADVTDVFCLDLVDWVLVLGKTEHRFIRPEEVRSGIDWRSKDFFEHNSETPEFPE